jgi:hypothetical protein
MRMWEQPVKRRGWEYRQRMLTSNVLAAKQSLKRMRWSAVRLPPIGTQSFTVDVDDEVAAIH